MRRFVLACVLCSSLAIGCHKSGDMQSSVDGKTVYDAPALSGDKYELTWGPVPVAVGVENTQCIWVQLPNDQPIKVHQMHNTLSTVSHHLIG